MLTGKVVVVPLGGVDPVTLAARLAAEGAGIVLVGGEGEGEAELAGRAATEIEAAQDKATVAVFTGTDLDALVELISELFR